MQLRVPWLRKLKGVDYDVVPCTADNKPAWLVSEVEGKMPCAPRTGPSSGAFAQLCWAGCWLCWTVELGSLTVGLFWAVGGGGIWVKLSNRSKGCS